MNYSADVKKHIADYESRGYEKNVNPVSKQLQVRKSCQLELLKFNSTDESGAPKWTARAGSDKLSTPVLCKVNSSPLEVTATLYKTSFDANAVIIGGTYSSVVTNVLTEKGKNTLNPSVKNSYFTMFSNAGSSVNSDLLADIGL